MSRMSLISMEFLKIIIKCKMWIVQKARPINLLSQSQYQLADNMLKLWPILCFMTQISDMTDK